MVSRVSLVLGGAQLGSVYGFSPSVGFNWEQRVALVCAAVAAGVTCVDTARAYGCSEAVVGTARTMLLDETLNIITKLSPLTELLPNSQPKQVIDAVHSSLVSSRQALGLKRLDTLMLHRAAHLLEWDGLIVRQLQAEQSVGRIGRLGVSIQSPAELASALKIECIEHIQMPGNLLDTRCDALLDPLRSAREVRGVSIHLRSLFMQGLLLSHDPDDWRRVGIENPTEVLAWLDEAVTVTGSTSRSHMAIRWALGLDWVDGIVLGIETLDQLYENLTYMDTPPLDATAYQWLSQTRPIISQTALDPSTWNTP